MTIPIMAEVSHVMGDLANGTGGRNRTDTPKERDFESRASTNSATPACHLALFPRALW